MRVAVIAVHMRDGREWFLEHGLAPNEVVIVTPLRRHAARGTLVENIYATPEIRRNPERVASLLAEVTPALLKARSPDLVTPCATAR